MVTIEQKLELFNKLLNQSMNLKYQEELDRLEKDIQSKVQISKDMIDKQAQEIEDRATKRAESKYAENISKSKVVMKRDIMSLKEKYFDILMNSLKIQFIIFVEFIV